MKNKNKILFLAGYSLRRTDIWENLLEILRSHMKLKAQVTIVYMQDGVIGLNKTAKIQKKYEKIFNLPISFYALLPDILSRGINPDIMRDLIQLIDYDDLVDLFVENPKVVSWL
jgi:sulfur relay protein TusB/DsrH